MTVTDSPTNADGGPSTDRLVDFAEAFAGLCEKVIHPALEDVMRRNTPGWLEVIGGAVGGGTDPDPSNFSMLNRHVTLRIRNFADLSFVAWNPQVRVVWRRNDEDDEDLSLYSLNDVTRELVENIVAQFLASLRSP